MPYATSIRRTKFETENNAILLEIKNFLESYNFGFMFQLF